jgi:hypothetical protein
MLPLPMPESRNNERGTRWFQAREWRIASSEWDLPYSLFASPYSPFLAPNLSHLAGFRATLP